MPRDREPWFKVKIGIRRSGKMAALPSDAARLGYFYILAEAKVQRVMGVFESRAHFAEVLGRFARYLPDYLEAGMVHEAPALCPECKRRHRAATKGQLVVHDYLREQRDPTNADRQAAWREAHGDDPSNADRNGSESEAVTDAVTPPVTAIVTATVTADSRARGTTATATGTRTTTERGSTGQSSDDGARAERPVDPLATELEDLPW